MEHKESVIKTISENRNIKRESARRHYDYLRNIGQLIYNDELSLFDSTNKISTNYDDIINNILNNDTINIQRKKYFLNSLYSYCTAYKVHDDIISKYKEAFTNIAYLTNLERRKTKREKQHKIYISTSTLKEIYLKYKAEYELKKNDASYVNYLISALYYLIPPLRKSDYLNMIVVRETPCYMDPTLNYCSLEDKVFILNVTKCNNTRELENIPDELINILTIRYDMEHISHLFILYNSVTFEKMSSTLLSEKIRRIFKNRNITDMRMSYVSELYNNVPDLQKGTILKKNAIFMGHLVSTQDADYNRFNNVENDAVSRI